MGFPRPLLAAPMHRLRVGRLTGLLLAACWLATLGLALGAGRRPGVLGLAFVALGLATGLALARRDWSAQPQRSVQLVVATTGLHSVAAALALDPSASVTWPLFLLAGALAGALVRNRTAVLVHAFALADAAVLIAVTRAGDDSRALRHALIVASGVMLAASVAAFLRVRGEIEDAAARAVGDPAQVHAELAQRLALDPDRLAHLSMGLHLQAGRGMGTHDGARLLSAVARSLAQTESEAATVATAGALAEQLGRMLAGIDDELDMLPAPAGDVPERPLPRRHPRPSTQLLDDVEILPPLGPARPELAPLPAARGARPDDRP